MGRRAGNPVLEGWALGNLGWNRIFLGELTKARENLEHSISMYVEHPDEALAFPDVNDPDLHDLTWLSWALWLLGYPDQALQRGLEAAAKARERKTPFTIAHTLILFSAVHCWRGEFDRMREALEDAIRISTDKGFALYLAGSIFQRGCRRVQEIHAAPIGDLPAQ